MKLTQQELESRLWGAANALRGPVDPADFKTYVFPMLFWKWISDTWQHEHHQAVEKWGDNLDDEIEADFHRFAVPSGSLWSEVTTKTGANLGVRIRTALDKIEQANPETLANVFGDAAWGNKDRLPESALIALVNSFNGIGLDPDSVSHDALGHAYEYLLKQFAEASGKKAGEFFTPPSVVHLLVNILDPKPSETVYDPACGSGGMLVETINAIEANGGDSREVRLYGQEVNLTTSAIARMNLAFHRKVGSEIKRGDTLREPKFWHPDGTFRQFDVVLANPPFSLQNWGADTWPADPRSFCGVPPAKNGDYAWIQHMIASMSPISGRVGVVMPRGALARAGSEAKIRQCLIEDDRLEAVIGLPPNLFYSTDIPACLLIFRANKDDDRRNHVLFVDASARFEKATNQHFMSEDDVRATLTTYRSGRVPDGEGDLAVRLVPFDEIKAKDFNLKLGLYLKVMTPEGVGLDESLSGYAATRTRRMSAERAMFARLAAAGFDLGSLDDSDGAIPPFGGPDVIAQWDLVPAGTVATQRRDAVRLQEGVEYVTMGVRWHGKGAYNRGTGTTATIKAKTLYRAAVGDFVFNRIDTQKGAFDVVPPELDGALATNEFPLYRPMADRVLARFLLLYFQQDSVLREIDALRAGSEGRARWKEQDFESWIIPLPPLDVQRRIVDLVVSVDDCIRALGDEAGGSSPAAGSLGSFRSSLVSALFRREVEIPASYDSIVARTC